MNHRIRKIAAGAALTAAAFGGLAALAGPASADTGPAQVEVTASLASTIQLTGVSPSVAFGPVTPGVAKTLPAAETYQVFSTGNYTVTATANNDGLHDPTGVVRIYSTAISINGHAFPNGSGATQVTATGGQGTRSFSDDWSVSVPTTPPPGGFGNFGDPLTGTYNYAAIAS